MKLWGSIAVSICLGLLVSVSVVFAGNTITVLWSKFNSTSYTTYEFDDAYSWFDGVADLSTLTLNGTGGSPCHYIIVAFLNDTDLTNCKGFIFAQFYSGLVKVYYLDGELNTVVLSNIDDATLLSNKTLSGYKNNMTIAYDGNSVDIEVGGSSGLVINDFGFEGVFGAVAVAGDSTDTALSGYVQIYANAGVSGVSSVFFEWLPTIMSFAMVGLAFRLLRRAGRR